MTGPMRGEGSTHSPASMPRALASASPILAAIPRNYHARLLRSRRVASSRPGFTDVVGSPVKAASKGTGKSAAARARDPANTDMRGAETEPIGVE